MTRINDPLTHYGIQYVLEHGATKARERIEHLRKRVDEENSARNPSAALRLAEEINRLQVGLDYFAANEQHE